MNPESKTPSKRCSPWLVAFVAITLVGFLLRTWDLNQRPLWWDEGLSAHFANLPLADVIPDMHRTHHADPPAYPLAINLWRNLAGTTPYGLRLLSAVAGTITIALAWTLARWLAGKTTAALCAALVALAPMQVYYTRETKSYAFGMACALLSIYVWGRRLGYARSEPPPRPGPLTWWLTYILSTALAVGSHYYLALIPLWQGLWVIGQAVHGLLKREQPRRKVWARFGRWAFSAIAILLLLLPPSVYLLRTTMRGVIGASDGHVLSVWAYVGRVLRRFSARTGQVDPIAWASGLALLLLGTYGWLASDRRWLLATWIAIPLTGAYLLQAAFPFFHVRFLLYLGPALYLLVSLGITSLARHQRKVAILALVLIPLWTPGLVRIYSQPPDPAEDPRPAIEQLRTYTRPDDALLYVYIWQSGYLHSYGLANELTLYRAHYSPETVGDDISAVFSEHDRLWLLSYTIAARNEQNLAGTWLDSAAYKADANWHGEHHLALYLAPDAQTPGVGPAEGQATFGATIELRYPKAEIAAEPGDAIAIPLRWRALADIDERYQVFVHLGQPDAPPVLQDDGPPRNGLAPTESWQSGQEVVDRRALLLPQDIPPDRYTLRVGLYRYTDGERLTTAEGEMVTLGHVEVRR